MQKQIGLGIEYIGVDDTTLDLFESQYPVPEGISYNSYVILDEVVYFGSSYRCSLRDGKLTMLKRSGEERNVYAEALYTNGDELFGVLDGCLWKIQIEKEEEGKESMATVDGVPIVCGEYTYSLLLP